MKTNIHLKLRKIIRLVKQWVGIKTVKPEAQSNNDLIVKLSRRWEKLSVKVLHQTGTFKPAPRTEFYGVNAEGVRICFFTDQLLDICIHCANEILPQQRNELIGNPMKFCNENEYVLEPGFAIDEITDVQDIQIGIVENEVGDFNHCSECGTLLKDIWVLDYPDDAMDEYLGIPQKSSQSITKVGWFCLGIIIDFCITHFDKADSSRLILLLNRIENEVQLKTAR